MNRISRIALLVFVAFSTLAYAQSGFNPFGTSSKGESKDDDAGYSKSQASRDLADSHKAKADADHLSRMLDGGANSVIVEFAPASALPAEGVTDAEHEAGLQRRKIEHRATKQAVKAQFASGDYEELRDFDALPMAHVKVNNRRALVKLLSHANVVAVYENKPGQHALAESLPLIGQPAAATAGYTGAGTTVVVLDTGVDYTNAAFGGCTAPGQPSATCKVVAAFDVATNDNSLDDSGHGTNVAGIVAGVAPGAKLAVLDVFTAGVGAYSTDVIAGINWAISNKTAYNIQAINISIGWATKFTSACSSSWATTPFANARAAGILPVVAAANQGWTNGMPEPACAPGAVSVGAVYDANIGARTWAAPLAACTDATTLADKVACFSNSASFMTMWAPGAIITAAGSSYAGTSQAAPHVAGAIAVLRAANAAPADTVTQTVTRLTSTGVSVKDLRNSVTKPRLNLSAAVNGLAPATSSTVTVTTSSARKK